MTFYNDSRGVIGFNFGSVPDEELTKNGTVYTLDLQKDVATTQGWVTKCTSIGYGN